jgi:hypothetical protein
MAEPREVVIYGLVDPRDPDRVRYVGKTVMRLSYRLHVHVYYARKGKQSHRDYWIRQLLSDGVEPIAIVLERTTDDRWEEEERRWIASFDDLTNLAAGGNGVAMPRTEEWNRRIGDAHRGKEITLAAREQIAKTNRAKNDAGCKHGHPWTDENTAWRTGKNGRRYRQCRTCRNEGQVRLRRESEKLKGRLRPACRRGHPMEGENLRLLDRPDGTTERICRECVRIRNRKSKKARAARDGI